MSDVLAPPLAAGLTAPGAGGKTASFALLALLGIGVPRVAAQSSASTIFLSYHAASTLAYVYLAVAALIPLLIAGFLFFERRVATAQLMIGLQVARLFAVLLLYSGLVSPYASAFSFAAIIWVEMEFVLASLVCWGLAGQSFAVTETKRAYPLIAAGEQAGALAMGLSIPLLMLWMDPAALLWVSAGSLAISVFLIARISATFMTGGPEPAAARVSRKTAGRPPPFNRLMRSYVLAIMAAALLANVAFYLIDALFYRSVQQSFDDPKAMASFLGVTFSLANAVSLVLSLTIAPRLLTRYGVGTAVSWLPGALLLIVAVVIGASLLGLGGTIVAFAAVIALKLADERLRVAFYRPAFQALYQPISAAQRVKAQARTEGVAEPIGIALAGLIVLGLGAAGAGSLALALVAVLVFAAWLVVARLIRRLHIGALGLAAARRQNIDMAAGGLDGPDARRVLIETLRSGEESGMIAAANLLARSNRKIFLAAAPGLIRTGGERLLVPILDELAPSELSNLFPVLRDRLWRERQPALRARILDTIGQLTEAPVTAVLVAATYAEGPEREAAYVGLARPGRGASGEQAEAELRAMAADGSPSERRVFLAVLARSGSTRFDAELLRLIRHRDPRTRRAAISVAGQLGRAEFVGPLARCLEAMGTGAADVAASALASLGQPAIPRLASMLATSPDRRVCELAAEALGRIGSAEAMAGLEPHVFHPDFDSAAASALALAKCGGRLGAGAARRTFDHVESFLASAAELRQAAADIRALPRTELLLAAIGQRAERMLAHALVLSALQRKGGGVDIGPLVSSRLRLDQKLYVAEMADGLMPPRLRPLCAALAGTGDAEAGLRLFHTLGLARPQARAQRLAWLISTASGGEWLRACALYAAGNSDADAREAVRRAAAEGSGVFGETARWLLRDGTGKEETMGLSTIEKVLILKKSDLFGSIPDDYLAAFAPMMESTYFGAGETVMREGERSDRLFTVVSGSLDISRGSRAVGTAGANDLLGDLAALDPQPVSETVVALTECHLLELTHDHLETLMSSHPDISFGIIKVLCRRLQRAQTSAAGYDEFADVEEARW